VPVPAALPAEPPALDLGRWRRSCETRGAVRRPHSDPAGIQSRYRYLPEEALRKVCEATEITPSQIAGVASFYSQFRQNPVGSTSSRSARARPARFGCEGSRDRAPPLPVHGGRLRHRSVAAVHDRTGRLRRLVQPRPSDDDRRKKSTAAERAVRRQSAARLHGGGARREKQRQRQRASCRAEDPRREGGRRRGRNPYRSCSCGIASGAQEVRAALEETVAALGGGAPSRRWGAAGCATASRWWKLSAQADVPSTAMSLPRTFARWYADT